MIQTINIKQQDNKIILSGEAFELLKQLEKIVNSMNEKIEKNNQFIWGGGKMNDKQKEAFEDLKNEYLTLKKIHEVFNKIVTENSIILYYMQDMANKFCSKFPVEIKTSVMPSQVEVLKSLREYFLSIQEIFNQYIKQ